MKTVSIICFVLSAVLIPTLIYQNVQCNYQYANKYNKYWALADKSSTIEAKFNHIQQFSTALHEGYNKGDFAANNAIWLITDNNSFEQNLIALDTLVERLREIQTMNPSSFEYNTAIQQITAQEQGEANEMLKVFEGCFTLSNFPLIWDWIDFLVTSILIILITIGLILLLKIPILDLLA